MKIEAQTNIKKTRGRPSEFNHEMALDAALKVFWTQGYEGTSMVDLTQALGINKPSIYAAFGNKEALFKKALSKYTNEIVYFLPKALNAPTAKQVIELFLTGAAEFLTNPKTPKGCMIVQAALACSQNSASIHKLLTEHRQAIEVKFSKRFDLAKKQGDLPKTANSSQLARLITTLHQGMSVQAKSGANKDELMSVAHTILQSNIF